jgi:hypothetical protein
MNVIKEWSFILLTLRCSCPGGTPCNWTGPVALGRIHPNSFPNISYVVTFGPEFRRWYLTRISSRQQKRKISVMKQFLGSWGMPRRLTLRDCQKNTHSNEYGLMSFGQFFGVSNQEHSMGSAPALVEPETSTCWNESRLPSSCPVSQAPCLEICYYIGRRLVLFFKSFWSDLASTWLTSTIFPETDDYKSKINDYSCMESLRIPRDTIPAQGNQVDRHILFR